MPRWYTTAMLAARANNMLILLIAIRKLVNSCSESKLHRQGNQFMHEIRSLVDKSCDADQRRSRQVQHE